MSGSDGALYLVRAGDDDLVVRDAQASDRRLLDLLAGGEPTVAELARELGLAEDDVAAKLDALADAGVIVPAAASPPLDPPTRGATRASCPTSPSWATSATCSAGSRPRASW